MSTSAFKNKDEIRTLFSAAMSEMYKSEVPQYGTLLDLVAYINKSSMERDPQLEQNLSLGGELDRLSMERHGAIRVGTPGELATLRRLFAVMGMEPVGYYDLAPAGVPVHATAFRAVEEKSLNKSPFRVFTSLLRLELIDDADLRDVAQAALQARNIFTPKAIELIQLHESNGGLTVEQAEEFVAEALETFRWHSSATVSLETFNKLQQQHRLIADVVAFKGPHINHLTPRTLDIDAVQASMPSKGIVPKAVIEGPPKRKIDILLRQTSFKALNEHIAFPGDGGKVNGSHSARFGEIEQRGAALTIKGRELYDRLLLAAKAELGVPPSEANAHQYAEILQRVFLDFPDDIKSLHDNELVFVRYYPELDKVANFQDSDLTAWPLKDLISEGLIKYRPVVYEDFLPVSAAGIFQSNLGDEASDTGLSGSSRNEFEAALGSGVRDEFSLYQDIQARSLDSSLKALRIV
ncbi:DUF1338 domain-containing protein [Pseudomonas jessenii]|jgi:uncharacterized glyoxalase superfamily metalloenzyme YdcJ|uniref:2-oxoadipate dioxygenase/decarboxylase n=1 Tax=Pseudomonas jessenii TaxID=77298 RepID=A0A231GQ16_PSEJE|nr:VOC family protein [Pseudomonas jessenii]OXR38709.1 DUF1338 domain-containing protein [Pseudomonas jessenii]SEC48283.1 Uncharacterized metalloenzyme YdcJ, glyoxalase superfamily [Pseudomonas jessenii]